MFEGKPHVSITAKDGREIERVYAGLYYEFAMSISQDWLNIFEREFHDRGFLEKNKTREDFLIWLVQVGLNEVGTLTGNVESPWTEGKS